MRKSRCCGCLLAMAALFILLILGWVGSLGPISDLMWHWAEVKTPWVRSPDGQWSAQVGVRGFMDGAQHRLYLRHKDERARMVCQPGPPSHGGLKWSPDSRRVAGSNDIRGDYPVPWKIWVYDTVSKHKGDGWGENPTTPSSRAQELAYDDHVRKIFGKPDTYTRFEWKWRGSDEIVGYIMHYGNDGVDKTYPLFVYSIKDTSSKMTIRLLRISLPKQVGPNK